MSWKLEFGPSWAVPDVIAADPRIVDISWHNDMLPRFIDARQERLEAVGFGVAVLCADHPDPAQRDRDTDPNMARFAVWDIGTERPYYEGEDPAAAVAVLIAVVDAYWTAPVLAERMRFEIARDIRSGEIPADVRTFAELHDYVDANEYGGLCVEGCPLSPSVDADMAVINAAQGIVDAWLQAGRPGEWPPTWTCWEIPGLPATSAGIGGAA